MRTGRHAEGEHQDKRQWEQAKAHGSSTTGVVPAEFPFSE
jgi:hypothetical protein